MKSKSLTIKEFRDLQTKRDLRQEKEANFFARCLLMPESLFREYVDNLEINERNTIKKIAKQFQVPINQVTVRLIELGYEIA